MFKLPIIRSCGHKELVQIDGMPPSENFLKTLDELERAESTKLCARCQASTPNPKEVPSYTGLTIAVFIAILVFISVLLNLGDILIYFRMHNF